MKIRTRSGRVTFKHPFSLTGVAGVQSSGIYSVETREERVKSVWVFTSGRTSTWIRICRNHGIEGVLQMIKIDPIELEAALLRDATPTKLAGTESRKRRK